MGDLQSGWFVRKNPIQLDDVGYPHLWKPPYVYKKLLLPDDLLLDAKSSRADDVSWPLMLSTAARYDVKDASIKVTPEPHLNTRFESPKVHHFQ